MHIDWVAIKLFLKDEYQVDRKAGWEHPPPNQYIYIRQIEISTLSYSYNLCKQNGKLLAIVTCTDRMLKNETG